MEEIRVTRADIIQMLKDRHEEEGYHVVRIFPHTGGYILDVVKKEEVVGDDKL
jgi:hypothetical protein